MTKPTTCSVPGCEGKHHARGWCKKHYQRWRRHGDPETTDHPRERVDDYLEEVRWLLDQGEPPERASQRVGVTAAAIARSAYRRGDNDLAAPFARIQKRDRKAKTK